MEAEGAGEGMALCFVWEGRMEEEPAVLCCVLEDGQRGGHELSAPRLKPTLWLELWCSSSVRRRHSSADALWCLTAFCNADSLGAAWEGQGVSVCIPRTPQGLLWASSVPVPRAMQPLI